MAKGNPVKWVFDGTKLDRATVKRHVLEALREPGFRQKMDDILEKKVVWEKFKNQLGREVRNSDQLIGALEDDGVFNIVFEIAE